jgi:membrane protein implicated in regulation of membrane protease activity
MKSKLFLKKIFKRDLSEFFLIVLGGTLSAIGGYLVSNKYWYLGIISFLSFFVVNIILSRMKQNTNLYGTSEIPPPASATKKGTLYVQYKK